MTTLTEQAAALTQATTDLLSAVNVKKSQLDAAVATSAAAAIEAQQAADDAALINGGNQYHVKQFGAACDGVTDDTAAIRAAVAMLDAGIEVVFGKAHKITGQIDVPFKHAWKLNGRNTKITQAANNCPIFVLTHPGGVNDFSRGFSIQHFVFEWANYQNATSHQKSIAIAFNFAGPDRGAGFFNFDITQVTMTRGYRTIAIHPDAETGGQAAIVWGYTIRDIYSRATGASIYLLSPNGSGGSPRCNFENIYITGPGSAYEQDEHKFVLKNASAVFIQTLEFNVMSGHKCGFIEACQEVNIASLRFEIVDVPAAADGSAMFTVSGSDANARIDSIEFQTISSAVSNYVHAIRAASSARVRVGNVTARNVTTGSGQFRVMGTSGTGASIVFEGSYYATNENNTYLWESEAQAFAADYDVLDFYFNSLPASQAATQMPMGGNVGQYLLPRDGYIVGMSVLSSASLTAGGVTVRLKKNFNSISGTTLTIPAGKASIFKPWPPSKSFSTANNHFFNGGNTLSATVESDSALAPTNVSIGVRVYVRYSK